MVALQIGSLIVFFHTIIKWLASLAIYECFMATFSIPKSTYHIINDYSKYPGPPCPLLLSFSPTTYTPPDAHVTPNTWKICQLFYKNM